MAYDIVALNAAAEEIWRPTIYEVMSKWDQPILYRTLAYEEDQEGIGTVNITVSPLMSDARKYTSGSGATRTADADTVTEQQLLLDQLAYKLLLIEKYQEMETSAGKREKKILQALKTLYRSMNVDALAGIVSIGATSIGTYGTMETAEGSGVDWTSSAAVYAEVERLIRLAVASLRTSGLDDGMRTALMGAEIYTMLGDSPKQNQARADIPAAYLSGRLNPIFGTEPIWWDDDQMGMTFSDTYGERGETTIPFYVYEPECVLFGVQANPSLKLYDEADFPGIKMAVDCKYGYKAFDSRKIRVCKLRVAGDPFGLS